MRKKTLIIAEAGVNHNGNFTKAKKLIDAAVKSGADVIKFQHFKSDLLIIKKIFSQKFKKKLKIKSTYNMLKKYELNFSQIKRLKEYALKKKIIFIATPFDNKSADELQKINVPFYKISSGDVNNLPLIQHIIKKKKPIILSTGRSSYSEIKNTISYLKKNNFNKYSILHCISIYPADVKILNLNSIKYLKRKFNCKIGFSDHSIGVEASIAAFVLGAEIIEKHITLNVNDKGPDHKSSTEPEDFKKMVLAIRNLEKGMGDESKKTLKIENFGKIKSRRSIYANKDLYKNQVLKYDDIICKRPALGINPDDFFKLIGKKIKKNVKKDEPLIWNNIY